VLLWGTGAAVLLTAIAWQSRELQRLSAARVSLPQQWARWQALTDAQQTTVHMIRVFAIGFGIVTAVMLFLAWVGNLGVTQLRRLNYAYCTRCGYPLVGVDSSVCPECGQSADASRLEHIELMPVSPMPVPPWLRRSKRTLIVLACLASLVLCAYALWRAARAW
jgi:hypothetical protein